LRSSSQNRLFDRSPPVASTNVADASGPRLVQRFVAVRYFNRMSTGRSASDGDGFADVRRQAGGVAECVARPVADPHYIVVGLDLDTTDQATAFLHFLETQVWASATTAPALVGRPRTAILEPA